jgi:GPI mannosyltransferase 3
MILGLKSIAAVFLFRLIIAVFLLRTAHAPDEYWQSLEVAYYHVFGKGELTWEWREGLRSYVHPSVFVMLFSALKWLNIDTTTVVWVAPKVVSALVCTAIDYGTFKVAERIYGQNSTVPSLSIVMSLTNWFIPFIGCRTLANSVEALALLAALHTTNYNHFLFVAGLGCALRTTFVLPCLPIAAAHVLSVSTQQHDGTRTRIRGYINIVLQTTAMVALWLGILLCVDRYFYGRVVFAPINFLHFNVVRGLSAIFGTHPWHWYFTQGVPAMLLTHAVPLLNMLSTSARTTRAPAREGLILKVCIVTILGYSFLSHKEFRFVFPILPLLLILSAVPLSRLAKAKQRKAIVVLAVTNAFMFVAFGMVHQRGALEVLSRIRATATVDAPIRLHVLMNCHATPGYSHLHGVVAEYKGMNCTVVMSDDGSRIPTQHHMMTEHPKEFVEFVYEGIVPTSVALARTMTTAMEVCGEAGSPGAPWWDFPDTIIIYRSYGETIKEFLRRNGFVKDVSVMDTFAAVEPFSDTFIDIYSRK